MDNVTLNRWKQLANDAVIATFGQDSREAQLATVLEQVVDELDETSNRCPTCSVCEDHGNSDGQGIVVDVDKVLSIQKRLKNQTKTLKDYHVRLATDLAEWETTGELGTGLTEDLAEIIEETDNCVDELEAEVLP